MNWRQHDQIQRKQRLEAQRLEAEQTDRLLNRWLYLSEIPAVWNHSDLDTGDAQRDEGPR